MKVRNFKDPNRSVGKAIIQNKIIRILNTTNDNREPYLVKASEIWSYTGNNGSKFFSPRCNGRIIYSSFIEGVNNSCGGSMHFEDIPSSKRYRIIGGNNWSSWIAYTRGGVVNIGGTPVIGNGGIIREQIITPNETGGRGWYIVPYGSLPYAPDGPYTFDFTIIIEDF